MDYKSTLVVRGGVETNIREQRERKSMKHEAALCGNIAVNMHNPRKVTILIYFAFELNGILFSIFKV